MDSGYYAATTGLIARTQALDVIANNLANSSTAGFKSLSPTFRGALASAAADETEGSPDFSPLNHVINDFGTLGGSRLDLSEGAFEQTGNPLDAAIDGRAFFAVSSASGQGELYTRNGSFHLSATRGLVTTDGSEVLGEQGPLVLPPGQPSISGDGTISVNGKTVGKLKLVEFPATASFTPIGNLLYQPQEKAVPLPGTTSSIRAGVLESSNVNPITAVVQLIEAQRSAEMLSHAMSMFQNQFDHTAAADLPRI